LPFRFLRIKSSASVWFKVSCVELIRLPLAVNGNPQKTGLYFQV